MAVAMPIFFTDLDSDIDICDSRDAKVCESSVTCVF